ncbi:MAG: hypothetical protein RG741_08900 [Bacteroidales bacterium]|nr:hypothetical protein [Bacteroidales bacterium]
MNCLNEEQIQQYLDDEYGKEEKEAIGQHMEHCLQCREALTEQRRRMLDIKQSLDLLVTEHPVIPGFKPPLKINRNRLIVTKFILPLAVAASILLIMLLRPFFDAEKTPVHGTNVQFLVSSGELDANKPVTEYPLTITVVAPDGSISQSTIN